MMPFAVIGSEEEVDLDGQLVRARIYPWGVAEVDNPKHSDFSRLRSALLKWVCHVPWTMRLSKNVYQLSPRWP